MQKLLLAVLDETNKRSAKKLDGSAMHDSLCFRTSAIGYPDILPESFERYSVNGVCSNSEEISLALQAYPCQL
jgi:hypothetical protein